MHNRPYIILKLVESADGFMGRKGEQVWISNEASKMLSHKWRSEVDAIMVGTNTAITDDPSLTNRLYPGENPMRIIVDHNERLPKELKVLSDEHPTLVISSQKSYDFQKLSNKEHIHVEKEDSLEVFLQKLYDKSLYSIIIEGGPKLLKSFYQNKLWDECRVIRSKKKLENGIKSPVFMLKYDRKYDIDGDQCIIAYNDLL
jgi:diaminohydroxyphosphoribosylaminopyrimidine deaminase/5-amino-6-(5-phosphoribosylamino)uracil reductase